MSEPKWWPKGVIPDVPGKYVSLRNGCIRTGWVFPGEAPAANASERKNERQFYGPIPDPPQEPPKLRRFTATSKCGVNLSGCVSETFTEFSCFYGYKANGECGIHTIGGVSD